MTINSQEYLQRSEPRPPGLRIAALSSEAKSEIAQFRFEYLGHLLKAAGYAVTPDPKSLAVNFHTGENLAIAIVDRADPRRISLNIIVTHRAGNLHQAELACARINAAPWCAKASATPYANGFELRLTVGVFAEDLSAFTNSLKAYTDDIVGAYNMFIDEMIKG